MTDVCYSAEALNIFEQTKIYLIFCIIGDTTTRAGLIINQEIQRKKENETRSYVSFSLKDFFGDAFDQLIIKFLKRPLSPHVLLPTSCITKTGVYPKISCGGRSGNVIAVANVLLLK